MPRPDLARILLGRATAAGVKLRFGTTFTATGAGRGGVDMTFSDGSTALRPARRRGRHPVLDPPGAWHRAGDPLDGHGDLARIRAPARPASCGPTCTTAGPSYIAGYCPTGENSLYAYIVEAAQDRSGLTPDEQLATMRELAGAYHGPWDDIRAGSRTRRGQLHLVRDPRP